MSPADGSAAPAVVMLAARDLVDSPYQPAGRSERGIDELAASIAQHGILEPLIVRGTEIVCGHRRRAAAVKIAITKIPCIVRKMSDEEAETIVLVENGQRVDLTPLEEAASLARLRDRYGWDVERIASRTSRHPATVRRRLLLLQLVDEARAALAEGKLALLVAEQLATIVDESGQREALLLLLQGSREPGFEPYGLRAASSMIDRYRLTLASAPWDLAHGSLIPNAMACIACPKRTSAQGGLFGDVIDRVDRCLDRACYQTKLAAHCANNSPDGWGNPYEDSDEDDERDPKPANQKLTVGSKINQPLVKPAVDLEPAARETAIEKGLMEIARKISDHRRKLDDPKLWKLLAGLVVRWKISADEVFERRGMPTELDASLAAIGKIADVHEVAGLLVELLCAGGPQWNGEEVDESPTASAAKFTRVDLMKMKSEALIDLQAERAAREPTNGTRGSKNRSSKRGPVIEPDAGHKCRVCGCTDEKPCDAGDGVSCARSIYGEPCTLCEQLAEACQERAESPLGGDRDESEIIEQVFEDTDLDGLTRARIKTALMDRIEHPKGAKLVRRDGKLFVKQPALPMPTGKREKVRADTPAEPARNLEELTRGMPDRSGFEASNEGAKQEANGNAKTAAAFSTSRSKAIKSAVHHTLSIPTGKPGRPAMAKLCEQDAPLAAFIERPISPDVNCTGCRTAYAAMKGAST